MNGTWSRAPSLSRVFKISSGLLISTKSPGRSFLASLIRTLLVNVSSESDLATLNPVMERRKRCQGISLREPLDSTFADNRGRQAGAGVGGSGDEAHGGPQCPFGNDA